MCSYFRVFKKSQMENDKFASTTFSGRFISSLMFADKSRKCMKLQNEHIIHIQNFDTSEQKIKTYDTNDAKISTVINKN